jgi:hypothetical protein
MRRLLEQSPLRFLLVAMLVIVPSSPDNYKGGKAIFPNYFFSTLVVGLPLWHRLANSFASFSVANFATVS